MSNPKSGATRSKIEAVDDALTELALNLHWSWNHGADELWRHLDAELWEETQNPWVILQTVSEEKIEAALAEPEFRRRLDDLLRQNRESFTAAPGFRRSTRVPQSLNRLFQHGVHVE